MHAHTHTQYVLALILTHKLVESFLKDLVRADRYPRLQPARVGCGQAGPVCHILQLSPQMSEMVENDFLLDC